MVNNKSKLRKIWYSEVKEKIKNHLLWLRWSWNEKDKDFRNIDFSLEEINNYWEYNLVNNNVFEWENLTDANFQNSDIRNISFKWAILKWTDLRNAIYETNQFTPEQLESAILTNEDYKRYNDKKKLEEENKKLKKEVWEKSQTLKITSDKQTNKLLEWFQELKENFALEERRWLVIAFCIFISLMFITLIPLFDIFAYQYTYKMIFWWWLWFFWLIIYI